MKECATTESGLGRGVRTRFAQAAHCQPAYMTRVLQGGANLSTEQADAINEFLGHDDDESRFFLLLVEKERAVSLRLKRLCDADMKRILERKFDLKERFKLTPVLGIEQQTIYFSSWHYAAMHLLSSVPGASLESMAKQLSITVTRASEVFKFLLSCGLVIRSAKGFAIGEARMHLGSDSPLLPRHHTNWRLRALEYATGGHAPHVEGDLHYTSVVSLSREDVIVIKQKLLEIIDSYNNTVKKSPEEAVACLCLDWFRVT